MLVPICVPLVRRAQFVESRFPFPRHSISIHSHSTPIFYGLCK
uniref:Uncharacterized protein n=1 Tax=Anopheles quadriannulatus TaxID=34691 RepID=A0A182XTQ6_ANOQN